MIQKALSRSLLGDRHRLVPRRELQVHQEVAAGAVDQAAVALGNGKSQILPLLYKHDNREATLGEISDFSTYMVCIEILNVLDGQRNAYC